MSMRDFRLPPRSRCEVCSLRLLASSGNLFPTFREPVGRR